MVEVKHSERLRGYDNFTLAFQVEQVYYMPYPCTKLGAWWVVYKVNPRERLYAPGEARYHDEVEEVYQDEELPNIFVIESGEGLDTLEGHLDD